MRSSTLAALTVAASLTLSAGVSEPLQGQLGVAARIGTLGLGGEAALALSERLSVRGGLGLSTLDVTTTFDDVRVDLTLPDSWWHVGLDLYLNSVLRVGAGVLFKPEQPTVTGVLDGPVEIGDRIFTPAELGTLTGSLDSRSQAPYVLFGFGKHVAPGIGLTLDVGASWTGDPTVTLDAEGGTFSDQAELERALEQEARNFEADMKTYLRWWPILSLGVRLGLG